LRNFAKQLKPQQSDGVLYETRLQLEAVYFVSTNIDVEDGLFNGATRILKLIEYNEKNGSRKRAWLKFEHPLIGLQKRKMTESEKTQYPSFSDGN